MATIQEVLKAVETKMKKTVEANEREFNIVRTGRASAALVEGVKVDCYGASMALKQLASISTPGPRLIIIQPWDQSIVQDIEKAILSS